MVVVSSDRRIAASLHDLRVQLWDWPTRAHLRELDESMCEEIVFAPDGKRLFVAHTNAPPSVVEDLAGTAKSRSFELPKGIPAEGDRGAGMLAVSSDGAWLVGRCDTVQVCLWSTKTGKGQRWTQPGTASPPKFLAFSQDNKRVLLKTEAATSFELEVPSLKPAAKEAGFKPERFD